MAWGRFETRGGTTKEAMAGSVPELGGNGVYCGRRGGPGPPRFPEGWHAGRALRKMNTGSRKFRQKLGRLVSQGRHAAHTDCLNNLPEKRHAHRHWTTGCGGRESKAFAKARCRSLQGAETTARLRACRDRTRSVPSIPAQRTSWHLEGASWRLRGTRSGERMPLPTTQSTWTRDTHASIPEQTSRW